MTDHNGVFVLNNATVYEKFAFVKANKQGYINGSRAVVPVPNGSNDIQITMLEKNIIGTVSSGSESEVTMTNGSIVRFQGGFIDASGNPYSGQVEVSMHYLEPNQETTFTQMPGMLLAQDASNNAKVLETYGMLGVNLFSPSGEQLNIAETTPATLEFPVSLSTPNAPETITLWHFDENVGYWKEQGEAIKVGSKYIAEVTHFSWWNCDLPLDYVNVCFNLRTHAELTNYYVEIIRNVTNQTIFSGYTNTEGDECGLFPANEEVTIKVYSDCLASVLYEEVVGAFSTDTSIEIIVPPVSDIVETTILATLNDCSGNPITNGYAFIIDGNSQNSFSNEIGIAITNGELSYNAAHCSGVIYNLIIYDFSSGTSTEIIPITLQGSELDLGIISTCTTTGGMFNGDVELLTQLEIDNFGLLGFTGIDGNLVIGSTTANNTSISDVNALNSLENVTGNLYIAGCDNLSALQGLNNLHSVGGKLNLISNPNLESLQMLSNLNTVGIGVYINNNDSLVTLAGLDGIQGFNGALQVSYNLLLESLEGLPVINELYHDNGTIALYIKENSSLANLAELNYLTQATGNVNILDNPVLESIDLLNLVAINSNPNNPNPTGQLYVIDNDSLNTLNGLSSLTSVGGQLNISQNNLLTSLVGLENLNNVGGNLDVYMNDALNSLAALENVTSVTNLTIYGNDVLSTLTGLESLGVVNDVYIGITSWGTNVANDILTDFCALTNVFTNGTYGNVQIINNAYNPTVQDIINGNCAQ